MRRICVYCGSSAGARPIYAQAAQELGASLARRGIGIVYGGGRVGLMGVLAEGALAAGGEVIGVIPEFLMAKELGHAALSELRVVSSMHERKAVMAELADGFVALPGGYGTYEELWETLTWAQLGLHRKPIGLLNIAGFYDPLVAQVQMAISEGFVRPDYRRLIIDADSIDDLLAQMGSYEPPSTQKWLSPERS